MTNFARQKYSLDSIDVFFISEIKLEHECIRSSVIMTNRVLFHTKDNKMISFPVLNVYRNSSYATPCHTLSCPRTKIRWTKEWKESTSGNYIDFLLSSREIDCKWIVWITHQIVWKRKWMRIIRCVSVWQKFFRRQQYRIAHIYFQSHATHTGNTQRQRNRKRERDFAKKKIENKIK